MFLAVVKVQSNTGVVDKVRTRLEQLDDFEEGAVRQMSDLSQQQYTTKIEQVNIELVQAWHSDQRVKALKIAIQVLLFICFELLAIFLNNFNDIKLFQYAKLLVDTSVMAVYPCKFILITDILDIFGKLVYDRLKVKAEYYKLVLLHICFTCTYLIPNLYISCFVTFLMVYRTCTAYPI